MKYLHFCNLCKNTSTILNYNMNTRKVSNLTILELLCNCSYEIYRLKYSMKVK